MQEYEKKQNYYKYLQKTEKVQFKEGNLTKLSVTATYMNKPSIELDDKSDEVFLIGVYTEEDEIESLRGENLMIELKNVKTREEKREERDKRRAERKLRRAKLAVLRLKDINATLPLDDNKSKKSNKYLTPKKIKLISNDSSMLEGIAFVSDWSQFYLVTYKYIAGNRLTLRVRTKKSKEKLEEEKVKRKKAKEKAKAKKKNNKKINLYNIKTLNFAKVAKYAL